MARSRFLTTARAKRLPIAVAVVAAVMCTVPRAAAARAWTIVRTPNGGATDNCLNAAASGYGRGGVWAVGGSRCYGKALIEHHQAGQPWRVVPPARSRGWEAVNLFDVVGVSPDDAWTVGVGFRKVGNRPMIEHWNGSAWTHVPAYGGYQLNAIARVPGTSHLWTVGWNSIYPRQANLVGYWNGTRWRFTASPTPEQGPELTLFTAIAATAQRDVWAIASTDVNEVGSVGRTYAEHWNGSRWTLVWLPGSRSEYEQLFDADNVPNSSQLWAVGRYQPASAGRISTLTERYADGRWTIVPSADRGVRSELRSVVAISPGNIWAVGIWYGHKWNSATLIEHYTHGRWHIVHSPNLRGMKTTELHGLTIVRRGSGRVMWAVGLTSPYRFAAGGRTLALRGR